MRFGGKKPRRSTYPQGFASSKLHLSNWQTRAFQILAASNSSAAIPKTRSKARESSHDPPQLRFQRCRKAGKALTRLPAFYHAVDRLLYQYDCGFRPEMRYDFFIQNTCRASIINHHSRNKGIIINAARGNI